MTPEGIRIGAMVSLAALAGNTELQQRYPVLTEAAGGIATPQIRNVGTLGGNLCQRTFEYLQPQSLEEATSLLSVDGATFWQVVATF